MNPTHKQMKTTIMELPIDLLIIILSLLGKSYDGAVSFVKAMSVNKHFLEAANKVDDLTDFKFRISKIQDHHQLYQQKKGLIYNCARAGNEGAQYLLAKVIMATCTQLTGLGVKKEKLDKFRNYNLKKKTITEKHRAKAMACSFLCHFNLHQQPESGDTLPLALTHRKLVRVFLSNLRMNEILLMSRHLENYVTYFTGSISDGTTADLFMHFIRTLHSINFPSWEKCLVRNQGYYYVKRCREDRIISPPQLQAEDGNEEYIDWRDAVDVFEGVRKHAIQAFDLLIPQLH